MLGYCMKSLGYKYLIGPALFRTIIHPYNNFQTINFCVKFSSTKCFIFSVRRNNLLNGLWGTFWVLVFNLGLLITRQVPTQCIMNITTLLPLFWQQKIPFCFASCNLNSYLYEWFLAHLKDYQISKPHLLSKQTIKFKNLKP